MTLRMQGYVTFERDTEGNPIEGTDEFVPQHDRDDYRPFTPYFTSDRVHLRPKLMTHIEDGHRTTYVELEPVVNDTPTLAPPTLERARATKHHEFPRAA